MLKNYETNSEAVKDYLKLSSIFDKLDSHNCKKKHKCAECDANERLYNTIIDSIFYHLCVSNYEYNGISPENTNEDSLLGKFIQDYVLGNDSLNNFELVSFRDGNVDDNGEYDVYKYLYKIYDERNMDEIEITKKKSELRIYKDKSKVFFKEIEVK